MSFQRFSDRRTTLIKSLDRYSPNLISFALFAFCLVSFVLNSTYQIANFNRIGEIGFGDSYILGTVLRLQKTGVIYELPGTSKSIPAISQYSPLLYITLSLPGRLLATGNPFIGPRLIELVAFLSCIAVAASITRALIPSAWATWWSVLLAVSIEPTRIWIMQIRSDFPGILFSLIGIRLLLSRGRWSALLAGAAAGFATQFKFTYVSALIAGGLWLLWQRRRQSVMEFAAAGLATSLGIYLVFVQREPQMLSQMFVFRRTIIEYHDLLAIIWPHVLREPLFLLGAAALPLVALRSWPRWRLLLVYLAVTLVISSGLNLHSGGNVNYFFEALFILIPLAAFGALQLRRCRVGVVSLFLTGLLFFALTLPNIRPAHGAILTERAETADWNRRMTALRDTLKGEHVLSFVPTVTHLSPEVVITEPFLLSYLERLGQIDLRPLQKRIQDHEFDLVVTMTTQQAFRGLPHLATGLRSSIASAYQPSCMFDEWTIHLPRQAPQPGLLERLTAIGCKPTVPGITETW